MSGIIDDDLVCECGHDESEHMDGKQCLACRCNEFDDPESYDGLDEDQY